MADAVHPSLSCAWHENSMSSVFREVRENQPWDRETAELPAHLHSHRAAQGVSNQEKAGLCLPGETVKGSTMLLNLNRGTKTQQEESSCLMTLSLCNKLRFSSLSKCAEIGITMGECAFLILSPCATAVILKAGGFDLTRVAQGFSPFPSLPKPGSRQHPLLCCLQGAEAFGSGMGLLLKRQR